MKLVKKTHQRTTATRHLDLWLRARELPTTKVRLVKAWDKPSVTLGQRFLVDHISSASPWKRRSCLVKRWVASRFRFVFGRPKYFMDYSGIMRRPVSQTSSSLPILKFLKWSLVK